MVGYFSVQSMRKGPPKNLTWREKEMKGLLMVVYLSVQSKRKGPSQNIHRERERERERVGPQSKLQHSVTRSSRFPFCII